MKTIGLCAVFLATMMALPITTFGQVGTCPQPGDDFFGAGPCCNAVTQAPAFSLPVLPAAGINMNAQWARISDCNTVTEEKVTINIQMRSTVPYFIGTVGGEPACDEVSFLITGSNASGTFSFNIGNPTNWTTSSVRSDWIMGKYTRTWDSLDDNGLLRQYYRFLISGDIQFGSGTVGSQVPNCAQSGSATYGAALMNGYIDISCESDRLDDAEHPLLPQACFTCPPPPIEFQASLVLTHYLGCQSHAVLPQNQRQLSPGHVNRHQDDSYHLVGPDNFSFSTLNQSIASMDFNNSFFDSVRSTVSHYGGVVLNCDPGPINRPGPQCLYEMRHLVNSTQTFDGCICGTGTGRYIGRSIGATLNCMGTPFPWNSFQITPDIPSGYVELNLGTWSNTARYDVRGVSALPVLGTIEYVDNCDPLVFVSGLSNPCQVFHLVFGIRTFHDTGNPNVNPPVIWSHLNGRVIKETLLDFGNHVSPFDLLQAGVPSYTNIVWTISEQ